MVIGEKYVDRFDEVMDVVDRIHEDTQAVPSTIFVETMKENVVKNFSNMCPGNYIFSSVLVVLVRIGSEKEEIIFIEFPSCRFDLCCFIDLCQVTRQQEN